MRHKNKNAHKDNAGAFDHAEKFNTPEGGGDVPNVSDQAQGVKPEEPVDAAQAAIQQVESHAKPAKKKNGFMAMLEERNQKRKARLKKLSDERNKKA